MIAQVLHMGDECHNRNKAGTSLFIRTIAPALSRAARDPDTVAEVLRFIDGNDHFFLNLSMAAMKAMLEPAGNIPGCTVVTVMARNGTDFAIRLSGTGDRWYICQAGMPAGLWLPGFTAADANLDIGDSAITETGGIGGFAMAGAPAIVKFMGGTPDDALSATVEMYEITAGEHSAFTIPRSISGAPLSASTFARSWQRASCRASTPASRTRNRTSAWSAPGYCRRPKSALWKPSRPSNLPHLPA